MTHPLLDRVMAVASSFALWWPLLLLLAVSLAIWGGFRMRAMLVTAALAVGITDGLVVGSLKKAVGRPRPHEALEGVRTLDLGRANPRLLAVTMPLREDFSELRIRSPRGNSFPSGHAANNFAVAAVSAVFFRRWGWVIFIPAGIVAYSRIYVGSHWPLDVAISCLLGAAIGILVAVCAEAAWRRWACRILPRVCQTYPTLFSV